MATQPGKVGTVTDSLMVIVRDVFSQDPFSRIHFLLGALTIEAAERGTSPLFSADRRQYQIRRPNEATRTSHIEPPMAGGAPVWRATGQ